MSNAASLPDASGTDWWEPARQREIAWLDALQERLTDDFARGRLLPDPEMPPVAAPPGVSEAMRRHEIAGTIHCAGYRRLGDLYFGSEFRAVSREHGRAEAQEFASRVRELRARREMIQRPDWMPQRPKRKVLNLWVVAEYWACRDVFDVDLDWPHCFACGRKAPASENVPPKARWNGRTYLERAHLVDRLFDGLDGPQNIVPLCGTCHRPMPAFNYGPDAIEWVLQGDPFIRLLPA